MDCEKYFYQFLDGRIYGIIDSVLVVKYTPSIGRDIVRVCYNWLGSRVWRLLIGLDC